MPARLAESRPRGVVFGGRSRFHRARMVAVHDDQIDINLGWVEECIARRVPRGTRLRRSAVGTRQVVGVRTGRRCLLVLPGHQPGDGRNRPNNPSPTAHRSVTVSFRTKRDHRELTHDRASTTLATCSENRMRPCVCSHVEQTWAGGTAPDLRRVPHAVSSRL